MAVSLEAVASRLEAIASSLEASLLGALSLSLSRSRSSWALDNLLPASLGNQPAWRNGNHCKLANSITELKGKVKKELLVTSALLVVTSALLVATKIAPKGSASHPLEKSPSKSKVFGSQEISA